MDIDIKKFKVDKIQNSSGLFSGQSYPKGWRHISKTNDGFGTVNGNHSTIQSNRSVVLDSDIVEEFFSERNTSSKSDI